MEHFNKVQKRWSIAGVTLFLVPIILGIVAAIGNIDSDSDLDILVIDQDKVLRILVDDLEN